MDELAATLDKPYGALLTAGADRASSAPECGRSLASDLRMKLRSLIRRGTPPGRRAVVGGRGTNAAEVGDAVTKKTILLVEDDDLIRSSIRLALEGEYEVLTAKDGIEGLRRFDRHRAQIQLIITDLMMPRLGGELLVEMVRRADADLPIIVMTGWAGEIDLDKLLARPRVALLPKPFQIEQLIWLMSEVAACRT